MNQFTVDIVGTIALAVIAMGLITLYRFNKEKSTLLPLELGTAFSRSLIITMVYFEYPASMPSKPLPFDNITLHDYLKGVVIDANLVSKAHL